MAAELREYRRSGLGGLLTEDVLRFATARALVWAGADPAGLRVEWPHPELPGSRVDLVAGGDPPAALLEFKFPREPNEQNAAWTMAFGEVLKDFYRLAAYQGEADRLFVYVEGVRMRSYMARAAQRYGTNLDADEVSLHPSGAERLPSTAARIIGTELAAQHVTARRAVLAHIDDELRLAVYVVGRIASPSGSVDAGPEAVVMGIASDDASAKEIVTDAEPDLRAGARHEILAAVEAVLVRSGEETFTMADVVAEMARRGTGYADSTIRTMIGSHMCRNTANHAATTYDDFERVNRGTYRLANRREA